MIKQLCKAIDFYLNCKTRLFLLIAFDKHDIYSLIMVFQCRGIPKTCSPNASTIHNQPEPIEKEKNKLGVR
jgi:hypothetical protein